MAVFYVRCMSSVDRKCRFRSDSWIRYAAAVEYITGFNYGNQPNAAFVLCTNMIANIAIHPPNMGLTNYWNSMSNWMKSSHETIPTVFRLNAAIWLAEHDRQAV